MQSTDIAIAIPGHGSPTSLAAFALPGGGNVSEKFPVLYRQSSERQSGERVPLQLHKAIAECIKEHGNGNSDRISFHVLDKVEVCRCSHDSIMQREDVELVSYDFADVFPLSHRGSTLSGGGIRGIEIGTRHDHLAVYRIAQRSAMSSIVSFVENSGETINTVIANSRVKNNR